MNMVSDKFPKNWIDELINSPKTTWGQFGGNIYLFYYAKRWQSCTTEAYLDMYVTENNKRIMFMDPTITEPLQIHLDKNDSSAI